MDAADDFRWQALFQHSRDPIFVLNRRRRILFANRAWVALVGVSAAEARGLTCTRRSSDRPLADLARTLCPPDEVMLGQSARLVRAVPGSDVGPPWWEIEFLPLADETGVIGVIGKIAAPTPTIVEPPAPIPETWAAIRTQAFEHFRLETLDGERQPTLVAQARLAAASRCPVYLVGELGTGKRWLARAIHEASDRRGASFAAVDCGHLPAAAIRPLIAPSAGPAATDRVGTVYLSEPAALPRELQAELAAGIADQTGPRVIAGTIEAEDSKKSVFLGQMLPELYDSLAVLVIPLPPLRARKEEMPRLVDTMLNRAMPVIGKPVAGLTPAAWDCFRAHAWPGNLRELYSTLVAAGRRATKDQIEVSDLPLSLQQAKAAADAPSSPPSTMPPLDTVLEEVERRMIRLALERAGGNQSKAAKLLGIWRPRLISRIKALGLD